jgi:Ras-related protein Rab-32
MKEGIPKERQEEFDKYCQENGFIGWKATSAKDNIGINDAFNLLVDHILKNVSELPKQVKKKTVILDDEEQNKEENSCRC